MSREKYRIRRTLERGPFADVVEAVVVGDHDFSRQVVLKQLRSEFADEPTVREAFIEEAQLVAALNHPNIVSILDFGELSGRPFIALEYVEGVDLDSVASRARVPNDVALHITIELLRALAHAHGALGPDGMPMNVTHRDITPYNVLLSWDGDVKLTGFSVAADRPTASTSVGSKRGTLAFMPPEQALRGVADRRGDLYGVGCLLHWMLVGVSPIESPDRRARHLAGEPLSLSSAVEPAITSVIDRAVRFDPNERFATADEMADALWPVLNEHASRDVRRSTHEWLQRQREQDDPNPEPPVDPTGVYDNTDLSPSPFDATPPSAEPQVAPASDSAVGVVIHGYRIDDLIARGGWGNVYRARHLTLNYSYAVKVLGRKCATPTGTKRLAREAMAMSRLDHPNIVPVLDYGVLPDGRPFLTMPLLEGRTLHAIIAVEGPLDLERAASFIRQIAEALAVAHEAQIVHRDLKPGNVIVANEGGVERAKILDFGIARSIDDALGKTQLTRPDRLLGTPWYVAPEQIVSPSKVDGAADIYSLGIVFYRMLKLDPPFSGSPTDVLRMHLERPPPEVPEAGVLRPLLESMLSKRPEGRPTATAIIEAIEELGFGGDREATRAIDPNTPSPPPDQTRVLNTHDAPMPHPAGEPIVPRNPWPLVFVVFGAVAVSAAITAAVLTYRSADPIQRVVTRPPDPAVIPVPRPTPIPREPMAKPAPPPPVAPPAVAPRTKKPRTRSPKSSAAAIAKSAARTIRRAGLDSTDVSKNSALRAAQSKLLSASSRAEIAVALEGLAEAADRAAADPSTATRKLERLERLLLTASKKVDDDAMRAYEDRYFLLRQSDRGSADARRAVVRQAHALERDLKRQINR